MPLYVAVTVQTSPSSSFMQARDRLLKEMSKIPRDVLSATILECALLCALSCIEQLEAVDMRICCPAEQVEPGVLFEKQSEEGKALK
eukprot:6466565-Amphidinium_carterae.1